MTGEVRSLAVGLKDRPLLALVLDDSPSIRQAFFHAGIRLESAWSADEAIAKAVSLAPDAVLVNLAMRGLCGDQAVRLLKSDPRTRRVPLIAITPFGASARARAKLLGCDAFWQDACAVADLVLLVESLAQRAARQDPAARAAG